MSVTIRSTRLPDRRLVAGDTIEYGVSHEIKVDGDGSWVSLKVTTVVREGEDADEAYHRVEHYLTEKMRAAVAQTVRNIQEMSS